MITIEVYSTTSRKYKPVRTARTRSAAFLALSLVSGRARAKDASGHIIANRREENGRHGKLTLA
jgi:ribosomal protein L34